MTKGSLEGMASKCKMLSHMGYRDSKKIFEKLDNLNKEWMSVKNNVSSSVHEL